MIEGLDLMLFNECAENMESALKASADGRVEGQDFPNEVRTLTMFLISGQINKEQHDRVHHILTRTRS